MLLKEFFLKINQIIYRRVIFINIFKPFIMRGEEVYCIKSDSIMKNYLIIIAFLSIMPVDEIILALGGLVILLASYLIIFKAAKKKRSQNKLETRFTGIKSHFNDIKDGSITYGGDDWLERRLKEDSDKYKSQLCITKK